MSLKFKRNYPILLALILSVAFFSLVLGSQRVVAYTTEAASAVEETEVLEQVGIDYTNGIALFDETIVHSVQVIITDEDYETMLSTYQLTGEKDYFRADIIIDGVRVNDVGIRLKGNSSLMTALGGMGGMGGGMGGRPEGFGPGNLPEGFGPGHLPEGFDPNNLPAGVDPNNLPAGGDLNNAMPGLGNPGQVGGISTNGQTGETKIPFLVKFDEFVSGQTYQGHTKLALRTYGVSYDEAMLEELLTNNVYSLMGLPATSTVYAGLQVNDDAETLYVISEVVDDIVYLEKHFTNEEGVLYKAEVGSSLTYVDDSPSSYEDIFSQETRVNDADFGPLIEFMQFLSESDDATFGAELPERFDVEAFATYLAINTLLVNSDSIAGMNNNYYLYYDDEADYFTLLYWDGNESFGGLGMGDAATADLYFDSQQGMGGMRGMGGEQNILLERFMANAGFKALYEEKLVDVYEKVFVSGVLTVQAEEFADLIRQTNLDRSLVDLENYEQSLANILSFITGRSEYLATTELLGE